VISAGFLNAVRLSKVGLDQHRILFYGAGSAVNGVAEGIAKLASRVFHLDESAVFKQFYLVDTKGLVTDTRGDTLAHHKKPFARHDVLAEKNASLGELKDIVNYVKPTTLIGLAGNGPAFTEEMIQFMCSYCERPIVFALSNPTSKSEITAQDAFTWSKGKAIVASGSPYPPCTVDGKEYKASQGNNMYIFPGVGLGCSLAQPTYVDESMLVAAAERLMQLVPEKEMESTGMLYPPISNMRWISQEIAKAVILEARRRDIGGNHLPQESEALDDFVKKAMWMPTY